MTKDTKTVKVDSENVIISTPTDYHLATHTGDLIIESDEYPVLRVTFGSPEGSEIDCLTTLPARMRLFKEQRELFRQTLELRN